ncbi:MAG TPA: hypothetical protein VFR58_07055, partial [Flavisolibacter sp.]|nr:hypothetical protein [Flavisolibacter sp.]
MRFVTCFLLVIFLSFASYAQRTYFIYLQTDSEAPFYVKLGDEIYSSASPGYLVLPSLADSTYSLTLGFPSQGESKFTIPISGRDHGFLIRHTGEEWNLFDLQSSASIKPHAARKRVGSYQMKTDAFSMLLAKAMKDSSLLYAVMPVYEEEVQPEKPAVAEGTLMPLANVKPSGDTTAAEALAGVQDTAAIVKTDPPVPADTLQAVISTPADSASLIKVQDSTGLVTSGEPVLNSDSLKATTPDTLSAMPAVDTAITKEPAYQRSVVRKYAESSTLEGFGLVFIDDAGGVMDTIRLIIPNPKIQIQQ